MTFDEARKQLNLILDDLKVEKGETIHFSTDMSRVPLPKISVPLTREGIRRRESDWNNFLLDTVLERLGPSGTLLMPTASNAYARHGTPLIWSTLQTRHGFPRRCEKHKACNPQLRDL